MLDFTCMTSLLWMPNFLGKFGTEVGFLEEIYTSPFVMRVVGCVEGTSQ